MLPVETLAAIFGYDAHIHINENGGNDAILTKINN
jgi:hypothetical protein